ncbi:putative 50S ribosomal protein L7Ae [Spiroplasma clarkii]|uniref:hypothetical protein n=1 Tax=Spiroplasma clarkii TaxID=2139 RepID=UPI000B579F20|nr:hypothetical protein [Spiroplasma clarkii]ARU91935.1 putative 50S ribosomal protein L7Ae [Spiroplasma clarkii]
MTIGIKNLLGSLGLAMSAGKLVAGATLFDKIKKNKVLLVLTVNDMGPSQLKKSMINVIFTKSQFTKVWFQLMNWTKQLVKLILKQWV